MKNKTQIAVILDRSGSMVTVRQNTIDNYNEFIESQKTDGGDADVKLVQFDDKYEQVYNLPLKSVPKLTEEIFVPRGMTALHDAIGRTVSEVGRDLANQPESSRPNKVVILILTDGQENASKEYNQKQVADMVKHQRDKYNWQFIFMGATSDAVLTAEKYNILRTQAIYFDKTLPDSYRGTIRAMSAKLTGFRSGTGAAGVIGAFTEEERKAAVTPEKK